MTNKNRPQKSATAKRYRRSVFGLVSGSALSQSMIALSIPIIARIFTPDEMGYFFAFDAYCDVLALGSTLALDKALYTIKSKRLYDATIATTLVSVALISCVSALALYVFLSLTPSQHNHVVLVAGAFVIVFARGAYYLFQSIGIRNEFFIRIAVAENVRSIALIFFRVVLGLAGMGVTALVVAAILGSSAAVIVVAKNASAVLSSALRRVSWSNIRAVMRRFRRNIMFEGTGQFLRQLPIRAPVIVVVALFSSAEAGFFSIALLLTYRPAEIIVRSVAEVARARIGASMRSGDQGSAGRTSRFSLLFNLSAAPVMVFAAGLGIYILEGLLFPPEWSGVGLTTLALSPYVAALMLARPLQSVFSLYRKHAQILILELTMACISLVGFSVCGFLGQSMNVACIFVGASLLLAVCFFNWVALQIISDHTKPHAE